MAIVRAPLTTDAEGKCTRWRVILYNPATHRQAWSTINGTRRDAEAFERKQKDRLAAGTYIPKSQKITVTQLYERFITDREARGKRTATLACYRTIANKHLLAETHGLSLKEVGSVRPDDFARMFEKMLASGCSASTVNRVLIMGRALFTFAIKRRLAELHPLAGFERYARTAKDPGRKVARGAYSEAELKALLDAARAHEVALIGLLALAGLRPGEAFALRRSDLDLEAGTARISRNWDWRGKIFTEPKTVAARRVVPLGGWLVSKLEEHIERAGVAGDALLFATREGNAYNPSNVRRDIWSKLIERAQVRKLDMYSLRHTFATFARSSGETSYNVSRALGHKRSTLVDDVYGHGMDTAMASVALAVEGRMFGTKLRVIEGGGSATDLRDVRQPLENSSAEIKKAG